jgi:acetoin utilization deacetylase AcuC-like enzyme
MTTGLFTHSACLYHELPLGHPESPDRLRSVLEALENVEPLSRHEARRATVDEIARVHKRAYVEALLNAIPKEGFGRLDADTGVSPGSGEAALRAAGALVDAVDHVSKGELTNAFCAVRPPGHHAEPARAMGFCLFNNIAVGALHARAIHGYQRVAVVDFDVHHGNGTQAMFERDADLFFGSTHQSPLYPGTGHRDERGVAGNILNAPLPPHAGSIEFRTVMGKTVLPALDKFAPDFIFISAGFDAHHLDPLANLSLHEEDYGWVTSQICQLAEKHCNGRVVSTLEGGYNLNALAESAKAHVRALLAG